MTYCLAITVDAGLVVASDSRTSAGVDQIGTYSKMFRFHRPGERFLVLLTSGNLATTQAVINRLRLDLEDPTAGRNLYSVSRLCEAADYVGGVSAEVQQRCDERVRASGAGTEATLLLGGQIGDAPHGIFLIYPQGNHIGASPYECFLQVGETKYGKPILDRIVHPGLALEDAARCALVSLDSTMRSNVSVGPPVDLLIYGSGRLDGGRSLRFHADTPYYLALKERWGRGLKSVFEELPRFDWE